MQSQAPASDRDASLSADYLSAVPACLLTLGSQSAWRSPQAQAPASRVASDCACRCAARVDAGRRGGAAGGCGQARLMTRAWRAGPAVAASAPRECESIEW